MAKQRDSWLRFGFAAALLAAANFYLHAHSGAELMPSREPLASFPLQVGGWEGWEIPIGQDVREILGAGDFLEGIYQRSPLQPSINLFIAYFPTQRTGSTMHSPQHCLPGSGWLPVEHAYIQLTCPDGGASTVNRYLIAKGLDRELVLYWYYAHGRVVASEYWAKFYLVADSMRMNRSDGALLRVSTPLRQEESVESGEHRLVEFTQQLVPLLDRYIPR